MQWWQVKVVFFHGEGAVLAGKGCLLFMEREQWRQVKVVFSSWMGSSGGKQRSSSLHRGVAVVAGKGRLFFTEGEQ